MPTFSCDEKLTIDPVQEDVLDMLLVMSVNQLIESDHFTDYRMSVRHIAKC